MNKTKIDWPGLNYTWNPVVGCRRGCSYCYAAKVHNIRHEAYLRGKLQNFPQYAKPFDEIQFFEKRLTDPAKIKNPSKIFVGSMCDLFSDGVSNRIIRKIISVTEECTHHTFMFLTKGPHRYRAFHFPINCQLGATVTSYRERSKIIGLLQKKHPGIKTFLSIEPLLGHFKDVDLSGADQIIVGAMTGSNPVVPRTEWIESIKHDKIYFKQNIRKYL